MGIQFGVTHRGRQPIELLFGEPVFGALGLFVHATDRHTQFVREVQLPQPVSTQHVQCDPLTLGRELELSAL